MREEFENILAQPKPIITLCAWHPFSAHLTPYWAAQGHRVSHGLCPDCEASYRAEMGVSR